MLDFSFVKSVRKSYQPNKDIVRKIIRESLIKKYQQVYIDISIVTEKSSKTANLAYRNIDKPTNVIALEYADTRDNFAILNGEIILCDKIIVEEASLQNKEIINHYIHMLVHGILHIQGFDHVITEERQVMEKKEIMILEKFAINNPYI